MQRLLGEHRLHPLFPFSWQSLLQDAKETTKPASKADIIHFFIRPPLCLVVYEIQRGIVQVFPLNLQATIPLQFFFAISLLTL